VLQTAAACESPFRLPTDASASDDCPSKRRARPVPAARCDSGADIFPEWTIGVDKSFRSVRALR
jgi:hypothetical protein